MIRIVTLALLASLARPEDLAPNYQFQYKVKDDYSGQDFEQEESRAGYNTEGEYEVQLPDGRRQIVRYTVKDPGSGYIADVQYQGEAQYIEEVPAPYPVTSHRGSLPRPAPPSSPSYRSPAPLSPAPVASYPSPTPALAPLHPLPIRAKPTVVAKPVTPLRSDLPIKKLIRQYKEVASTSAPLDIPSTPLDISSSPVDISSSPVDIPSSHVDISAEASSPPVYIPSRKPKKAEYKDIFHMSESKMLHSLFRGDVKDTMMPAANMTAHA